MSSNKDKIRKIRAEVAEAAPAPTAKPTQDPHAHFHVSEESKRAIATIEAEMERASREVAPSEEPAAVIDESKVLDDAFKGTPNPPALSTASLARRKSIEARCGEVDIDELFVSGEVRQDVEIRPKRLVVTYRTLKGKEDLYIKRRLSEVRDENMRYAEDRFLYMLLSAHIHTYNGRKLPSIFDENGVIQDELFDKRFDMIADIPQIVMEDIWVNYVWFEARVRRALEAENLSDG